MSDHLIEAKALRDALSEPGWMVFDVRYSLSDPKAGEQAYLNGHIPGARYLDQGTQLAGQSTGGNGRHPLPDPRELHQLLRRHGMTPQARVVLYDHNDGSFAARAWWLLRWLGYSQVRILDGGMQAWRDAGGPLQASDRLPPLLDAPVQDVTGAAMPIVGAADIASQASGKPSVLLDARTAERYRGESEPIDPVAGRIPGALNRPVASNLQTDGRFKPAMQLHDEFKAFLGNRPPEQVVHYCGSGITACHNIFAMELAGLGGSMLYPGSWSEWCSDPARPVARG